MDAQDGHNRKGEGKNLTPSGQADGHPTYEEGTDPPRPALRRFVGVMLVVYWLTLFVVMHVRFDRPSVAIPGADKVVHIVGYGVLGMLLTLWMALRDPLRPKVIAGVVLTIALYGIVDELLQIPVGRDCDPADWLFDLIGGSAGVAVVTLLSRQRRAADEPTL